MQVVVPFSYIVVICCVIWLSASFQLQRRMHTHAWTVAAEKLTENVRAFEDLARKGLSKFKNGDLKQALHYMDQALAVNSTQPLVQRGIMLYCDNQFKEAAEQLHNDIEKLEHMKFSKANELRLWHSACYNKLGCESDAVMALDLQNTASIPLDSQSHATNNTMLFFGGQLSLEYMLNSLEKIDAKDPLGIRFYGNFHMGLYYDSVGQSDLAQTLLSFPAESTRYPNTDMWYHLPRMLYKLRYPTVL